MKSPRSFYLSNELLDRLQDRAATLTVETGFKISVSELVEILLKQGLARDDQARAGALFKEEVQAVVAKFKARTEGEGDTL